jgi:hypothetical protein
MLKDCPEQAEKTPDPVLPYRNTGRIETRKSLIFSMHVAIPIPILGMGSTIERPHGVNMRVNVPILRNPAAAYRS